MKKAVFSRKVHEKNGSRLIYYPQMPFRSKIFVFVFILSSFTYFIIFGFLSNIFILFNDDGTVFTLIPPLLGSGQGSNHNHSHTSGHDNLALKSNNLHSNSSLQSGNLNSHIAHSNHDMEIPETIDQNFTTFDADSKSYPSYSLIICCNNFGYVPMLTIYINSNFSFLIIPLNFFMGVVVSLLVGLNTSMNIFVIKQLKINLKNLSKGNLFGGLGLTAGLLIGCPTCAGSFLYSIAGFSSLIAFSSLSLYQMLFVVISIPLLIVSLVLITNLLRKRLFNVCR